MKWYNEKDAVALTPPSSSLLLCFSSFLFRFHGEFLQPEEFFPAFHYSTTIFAAVADRLCRLSLYSEGYANNFILEMY